MRPAKETTSTANRAAVSKVSTAWACCRQRQRTCGQRAAHGGGRPPGIGNAPAPRSAEKEEPRTGLKRLLVVVERQPVQHGRVGIEHQQANVGERSQVEHFHEGLRHALSPVLLQLFGGDAFDMLQVRIRPGGGDQLHADRRAVRDAEGDEQKTARRGDVGQFGEKRPASSVMCAELISQARL